MNRRQAALDRERMLRDMQRDSFDYFVHEVNPANGLVCDKTASPWPASIAAVGIGLTVYPIGVERGLMRHTDALRMTLTALRFLMASEQSDAPNASHFTAATTSARRAPIHMNVSSAPLRADRNPAFVSITATHLRVDSASPT